MAQFPITKTADHTTQVGNLYATQDGSSNYLFPTWLATSAGVEVGTAASPLYVSPGTGATFAISDGGGSITVDGTVSVSGSVAVTNAGTFAVQAAQSGSWSVSVSGSVAVTDNSGSLTVDAPVGTPVFVRLSDGTSAISTLPVSIGSAVAVTDNSGSLTVDDGGLSLTVDNGGTFAVQAAQSGTWTVTGAGGTFPVTDSGGSLTVDDGGSSLTVDNAGTFAVQAAQSGTWTVGLSAAQTLATVTTVSTVTNVAQLGGQAVAMGSGARSAGTLRVTVATDDVVPASQSGTWNVGTVTTLTGGGVAHDSADSGNPVKVGFKATTSLAGATMVAAGDRVDAVASIDGAQIVRPECGLEDIVTGRAAITDGSSTSVISAGGAGVKTYLTSVVISNSSSTDLEVDLRDGTAGSVIATFPVPQKAGVVFNFSRPLPFSANTAIAADPSASATTVTVTLVGFRSKI